MADSGSKSENVARYTSISHPHKTWEVRRTYRSSGVKKKINVGTLDTRALEKDKVHAGQ